MSFFFPAPLLFFWGAKEHPKLKRGSLFFSLSQGYHTLLAVFAVRCLPHHTFLQYIDHGVVQLTETFVSRLMTGTRTATNTDGRSWETGAGGTQSSTGGDAGRLVRLTEMPPNYLMYHCGTLSTSLVVLGRWKMFPSLFSSWWFLKPHWPTGISFNLQKKKTEFIHINWTFQPAPLSGQNCIFFPLFDYQKHSQNILILVNTLKPR